MNPPLLLLVTAMASLELDSARACEEAETQGELYGSGAGLMCRRAGPIKKET